MKKYTEPKLSIKTFGSRIQLIESSNLPDNAQDNMAVTMYKKNAVSVRAAKVKEVIKMN